MSITAEDLAKRFGGTVAGPSPEDLAKRFGGTVQAPTAQPSVPNGEAPQLTKLRQLTIGASPQELVERAKGALRSVGRVGMGALQYGQYLAGAKVSPTPLALGPSPNPNQAVGEKLGQVGLAMAAGMATSGASLPVQAAVGSAVGGMMGGQAGAIIGGAVPVAGQAVSELGQYAADKEWAAKLWNAVAKVKAGRQGTQLDMASGEFKTLPGRAMVDEDIGPLSNVARAWLAKPNASTQGAAYKELLDAGLSMGRQLGKVTTPVDITADLPLNQPKVIDALDAVGVKPTVTGGPTIVPGKGAVAYTPQVTTVTVTPTEAHAIRSDLGSRINWNPSVYNDANEALKETYFKLGNTLDSVLPDSIKPTMKRWQEAYLFNKALATTMEKAANNPTIIPPVVGGIVRKAIIPAGLLAGYHYLQP